MHYIIGAFVALGLGATVVTALAKMRVFFEDTDHTPRPGPRPPRRPLM